MTFLALLAILATFFVTCECYFSASLLKSAKARAPHLDLFGGGKRSGSGSKKVIIKVDGKKVIEADSNPCNLRKELQKNKIDVYPLRAKFTGNCGGAGICGTCAVKVQNGMKNINPASKNEQNTLKTKSKDATDVRLSCCARVSGPIEIKTKVY
jgi:ferredoxin